MDGWEISTVDLYRKVCLACAEGTSQQEDARQLGVPAKLSIFTNDKGDARQN